MREKTNLKKKYLVTMIFVAIILFLMPNMSKATVEATRDVYSNNGSMKFYFTGLELDATHEYSWGFTSTTAAEIENWYTITDYTETTATVNVLTTTSTMLSVVNASDTAYITIKDATEETIVVEDYKVDLTIPYLQVTNYTVIENGTTFKTTTNESDLIAVAIRNASKSVAYYQYEEITDSNIISEYETLKNSDGDYLELQYLLSTNAPTSNWTKWSYWNGHSSSGLSGFGYPTSTIEAPDEGLYYLWVYFAGNNIKDVYGYILVDNLSTTSEEDDDTNNTNSNSSSSESDNNSNSNNSNTNGTTSTTDENDTDSNSNSSSSGKTDDTTSSSSLPYTGVSFVIVIVSIITLSVVVFTYKKMNYYKDIE